MRARPSPLLPLESGLDEFAIRRVPPCRHWEVDPRPFSRSRQALFPPCRWAESAFISPFSDHCLSFFEERFFQLLLYTGCPRWTLFLVLHTFLPPPLWTSSIPFNEAPSGSSPLIDCVCFESLRKIIQQACSSPYYEEAVFLADRWTGVILVGGDIPLNRTSDIGCFQFARVFCG